MIRHWLREAWIAIYLWNWDRKATKMLEYQKRRGNLDRGE